MALTITDVLNTWNQQGVFSYVIPFLLIFAVVFAILEKTGILSGKDKDNQVSHNRPMLSIISVSVALLSLQFDIVGEFFSIIFPRFGVGLSIFLVLLILLGFFFGDNLKAGKMSWIGWLTGIGVVIWALANWDDWGYGFGLGGWISEYFWAMIILAALIGVIVSVSGGKTRDGDGNVGGARAAAGAGN